jgi:signal transduction histidine kinase/ligand-binding sensor domain-containing protein
MVAASNLTTGLRLVLTLRWLVISSLLLVNQIHAQSVPGTAINYLVDVWDTENNLPSSTVTSLAQTPDGYLWVGTYNGLARFDGSRFETFDPVSTPALTQARIQGLFVDARGTLWINTYRGGLTTYRDGVFRNELADQSGYDQHATLVASTSNTVSFIDQYNAVLQGTFGETNTDWKPHSPPNGVRPIFQCADRDGQLWFLTRDGHIIRFAAGEFQTLPDDGGLAGHRIYTMVADSQGRVWAGAENEIAVWNGTQFANMTPTNGESIIQPQFLFPMKSGAIWVLDGTLLREMVGTAWVTSVPQWRGLLGPASSRAMGAHEDKDGGLWFNHYGNGLFHITPDSEYQRLTAQNGLPGDRAGAWFQSKDGNLWAGVDRGGLVQLRTRTFQVIGPGEGLPVRTALTVCQGADGTIWIGTAGGGLSRWSDGKVTTFPVGPSTSANFVFSTCPMTNGDVWMSAAEGEDFYQFTNNQVHHASWEVHGIKAMLADHHGRVWLGTKTGVAWTTGKEQRALNANMSGNVWPAVRALTETPDGTVWAGADDGTIFRCSTDTLTPFHADDALAHQPIYSMVSDSDGTIWAGTFRGGLLRFKDGHFSRITSQQGLPFDSISQILIDDHHHFWFGTRNGIYRVSKFDLNAIADGRTNTLDYVTFGLHAGLPSLECSDGYQPACWHGTDGRLWFTTTRGAVWVNPTNVMDLSTPPPVYIDELRVDGELTPITIDHLVIPPGHKQLDFRFTAISFDAGNLVRFRYRVAGLDPEWVDIDTHRTVQLRNVPAGSYRFQVIACNSQGVWNDVGASVAFKVLPFFYQTWWFKTLAAGILIGGLSIAVRRAATRKYRRKLAQLEKQHAIERDRARIAKDIHDDIGAGLTQITLLTELARREPEQTNANLGRITDSARHLTRSMDEIVWAVDPQHDTLPGLMDYISAYAEDYLRVAEVRCRMDLPLDLPPSRVDAELRYNLFLAVKEVLNNIVKHAKATEVWLRLKLEANSVTLVLEDNGRGISSSVGASDGTRISSGYGLANLEKRLSVVGGRCRIESLPGQGTRVEMTVTL